MSLEVFSKNITETLCTLQFKTQETNVYGSKLPCLLPAKLNFSLGSGRNAAGVLFCLNWDLSNRLYFLLVLADQVYTGGQFWIKLKCPWKEEISYQLSLPVITVGEFHVHAMATHEGLAVQRDINIWRMLNRLAHYYKAGEKRLFIPTQSVRRTSIVHFNLSSAVQNLK